MVKMNWTEFRERALKLQRARRIFIASGLTKNITHAFEAYRAILEPQAGPVLLDSGIHGRYPPSPFDGYPRPLCPKCSQELRFRIAEKKAYGIKSNLVCTNRKCRTVLVSRLRVAAWLLKIRKLTPRQLKKEVKTLKELRSHKPLHGNVLLSFPKKCPKCGSLLYIKIQGCCKTPHGSRVCESCGHEEFLKEREDA